jgi:hypothetical protein
MEGYIRLFLPFPVGITGLSAILVIKFQKNKLNIIDTLLSCVGAQPQLR